MPCRPGSETHKERGIKISVPFNPLVYTILVYTQL